MRVLRRPDLQLHCVKLTVHAVIVEDLLFTRRKSKHHSHNVEAEGARVVLGALVFEGGRLAAIVDHEA